MSANQDKGNTEQDRDQRIRDLAENWPDFSPEQAARLAVLLRQSDPKT